MRIKDLIDGNFYCLITNNVPNRKCYFKFKKCDNDYVYNYGYQIIFIGSHYEYQEFGDDIFSYMSWFEDKTIYDISYSIIVEYLPDNNDDKISYLRKKKIESLLKNQL